MNVWKDQLLNILNMVTCSTTQTPQVELVSCIGLSILVAIFALKFAGRTLSFPMAERGRAMIVVLLAVVLMLAATAAFNIYAAPHIKNPTICKWLPLAAATAILLLIVIPVACFLFKSHYIQTLFACVISIIAGAAIVIAVHAVAGAVKEGDKGFKKTKLRTDSINEIITK